MNPMPKTKNLFLDVLIVIVSFIFKNFKNHFIFKNQFYLFVTHLDLGFFDYEKWSKLMIFS